MTSGILGLKFRALPFFLGLFLPDVRNLALVFGNLALLLSNPALLRELPIPVCIIIFPIPSIRW
jgi:hypothetical protein